MHTPKKKFAMTRPTGRISRTRLVGRNSPLQQSPFATAGAWEGVQQGKGRKRKREEESSEASRPRMIRKVQDAVTVISTKVLRKKSKIAISLLDRCLVV